MNSEKEKQSAVRVKRDWIIKFREKFGLSQKQLGELLGCPQTSICYWEVGRPLRGSSKLVALALERLGQILGAKDEQKTTVEERKEEKETC